MERPCLRCIVFERERREATFTLVLICINQITPDSRLIPLHFWLLLAKWSLKIWLHVPADYGMSFKSWRRTQKRGNYTKEGAKKSPPQASRCSPCGHSRAAARDRPFPSTVMIASYDQLQGSSRHPLQPHLPPPFFFNQCNCLLLIKIMLISLV